MNNARKTRDANETTLRRLELRYMVQIQGAELRNMVQIQTTDNDFADKNDDGPACAS
jgi:hypothetical protein